MSRHHHRFERDYRAPWERRDIRLTGLHNGGANQSCASAVVNGNNRPGLLPLPIIPSLLPTPTPVVVTTAGSEVAAKRGIAAAGSVTSASTKVSPGDNQSSGLLLAPGVRWGQTPINQLTPWDTDEPPSKLHRDGEATVPAWVSPVTTVSQPSLLPHTYALPHPPSYNHSVTAQSPIIGVTSVPPSHHQHSLMTAHFQLTPHSTPQPPAMVLSMPGQPPYATAPSNHVVHPSPHGMMGNGQLSAHHPGLIQLSNGQGAAAAHVAVAANAPPAAGDNQEGPNGLQMLRTVGMGKYEFSDPGHPKGSTVADWGNSIGRQNF